MKGPKESRSTCPTAGWSISIRLEITMPFPSFRSKKSISSTPEVTINGDRQWSSDASTIKDWTSTNSSEPAAQASYSQGFEFKFYNPDTGIVYYRPRQPDDEINPSPKRPFAPEQGDRNIPWESYQDLPADHLVFTYPDEVKNMLYARGIGM